MIERIEDPQIVQNLGACLAEHYAQTVCEQVAQRVTVAELDPVMVGGATGVLAWGWLEIEVLWVVPEQRCKGLGSRLLARMEQEALAIGARGVSLRCVGPKAASFYARHGYRSVGTIADFPAGHTIHWLAKQLASSDVVI